MTKATAATNVPIKMYGVLRPYLLFVLSDNEPNNGSINSAKMLSSAITKPDDTWVKPNLSINILAMILSYVIQNIEITKNAIPTKIVFL